VNQSLARGIPNVFKAVITDKDNEIVQFHHTKNVQSSSILEFGTHASEHPHVVMVGTTQETTITIDTLVKQKQLDPTLFEFWNFDIQGAELLALKGAINTLQYAKVLYLEVNIKELYKGCGLMSEIDDFLKGYGFSRAITNMTQHGWGDAVYIRQIPKLSVCIPTMNRWSFLEKNIPQYLANPLIDEIVVCDETGTDCALLAERFKNPKLKLFTNSERLGAFRNKEQAVRNASNDWIALIDSDNFSPSSYFDAWIAYIKTNPMTPNTVYAPSRTIPTKDHGGFNLQHYIGKTLTKQTYRSLISDNLLETVINMGNYIVNRKFYLNSSDPTYASLFPIINAWEAKLRTWLLLNQGAKYVFPAGFEYSHTVHNESLYLTTKNEIYKYNSTITDMYNTFV
jgi:hypothetical protein